MTILGLAESLQLVLQQYLCMTENESDAPTTSTRAATVLPQNIYAYQERISYGDEAINHINTFEKSRKLRQAPTNFQLSPSADQILNIQHSK